MDPQTQDESDRNEPEIQDDGTEAANIDDEDVEELHTSLKEVVQDPSVKPKFQCLIVDPSFSMVTVQSEDSGIVWETASSRCSTPWASEASSPSDTYSLEGSGTQGNIVIIMDDDKIKRRKKTSSRGKFGDRFRRPGSRLSGAAIGEERPAMIEVSVPNIQPENSEDGQSAESKSDNDQDLFNLISEGFEILNIVVPSKLPTVDEENSSELADNLTYLEDTPKIKTKCKQNTAIIGSHDDINIEIQEIKDESQMDLSQAPSDEKPKKEETDVDYLEKFTLLDQHVPGNKSEELEVMEAIQQEEPQVPEGEQKVNGTVDVDSFVVVSEVESSSDHLDEVFYGTSCDAEPERHCNHKDDEEHTSGSTKTLKVCGSTLFGSQENILTPIFLPSGPPKIIDQDLLDEPRAMSFHYSDLYEDAVGDRKKDDDFSDRESVVSEKSFKRRFSDSDDGDGYLEKFILKDDTPVVKDVPKVDIPDSGRVIWPQNKFEMTGCLIRAPEENESEVENVDKLESQSDTKAQTQSPDSLKDGEGCEGQKTGCETVQRVSDECGTKTGCAVVDIVSHDKPPKKIDEVFEPVNQETSKSVLIEDRKQSEVNELKCVDSKDVQVSKLKNEIGVPDLSQQNVKTKMTSSVPIPNSLKETHEGLESTAKMKENIISTEELLNKGQKLDTKTQEKYKSDLVESGLESTARMKENIVISNEEMLNKGQKLDTETQEKRKTDLVEKKDVTDMPALTNKDEETEIARSQELIQQELCVGEKEYAIVAEQNKETKPPGEKEIISEPKCQKQVSAALPENKSELIRSQDKPACLEKNVRDAVGQTVVPECENQEQVTDKIAELDVKEQAITERKGTDLEVKNQLETLSEQKALEGLTVSEVEPISTEAIEKTECELHAMPLMMSKVPSVQSVTTQKVDILTSAVESLNNEVPQVLTPEKKDLGHELGKVEKDSGQKENMPPSDNKIGQNSGEKVAIIPPVKFKVTVPQTVPKEVAHTEEDSGLGKEAKNANQKESAGKVSEHVYPVAAVEVFKMPVDSIEGKSNNTSANVLLKDTQEENIWRTLESKTPSPPVEIEDSTMRVSPLELMESTREDDNLIEDERIERGRGLLSTLRSFSPQEDLSGLDHDAAELDLQKELSEDLGFEIVSEQDVIQLETEVRSQEHGKDQSTELTTEADYEFIEEWDGAQVSELDQFKEDGEIQPMDAFCVDCQCPVLISNGGHENHKVSTLEKAFEDMKDQLSNWISDLQERSETFEDMVSELELAYNSVEEQCKDCEKAMDEQNEEMLQLVMDRYNEMSLTMEEEKKTKLEQLYDQIVSFQENVDSAKETLENTGKDMEETDDLMLVSSYKDIDIRLKTALESTMSLELGPRGLLVFEDYAKGTTGNGKKNRQVIPVPQQPHLLTQEPNSATSTSVTVYWTVNEGDIIDCFQVYCMEEPQGAIAEEYRVTVKESFCNLEELEPDKCYKVWVMALNYTGCSLPSEKVTFRTAPSVPVINPEACTVLWDSATIRWNLAEASAAESFTLEYCRQYAMEGEGLRSVSGIKSNEHTVLLQPNENFLFYIKSVNAEGSSEQSEAALISTRGTRFHLLSETANRMLQVSNDKNSVLYPVETYNEISAHMESPAVMGELLPCVGYHYWETVVAACKAYRIGIAYQTAPQESTVGDNNASWCLHCVPTSISCRFELLHDNVESDIFVTDVPARIGTLLDFTQGRLVFFNAQNGQCLGSFHHAFNQPCSPVFALERPGNLKLKMTTEVPEW
ncbi:cardiomyopathy-associated protein 5 [Trichomycterus rosablanca]|uniref:cardiomyopathy-associated protein 5 n=1 Tax=Trichomycterus rosablanca TaxID=2290929 RepID=UPI002F359306